MAVCLSKLSTAAQGCLLRRGPRVFALLGKVTPCGLAPFTRLPPLILGTYFAFALAGRPQDFTWRVAALAAVVSALPAMVRAARAAFEGLPRDYGNAARSLGASGWRVFWRVMAPLAYRPILAAASLAFARLAAEYAVTILVAAQAGARSALMAGPVLQIG